MNSHFLVAAGHRKKAGARLRTVWLASALAVTTALLCGCAVHGSPATPTGSPTAAEYWKAQRELFLRTYGDGPQSPAPYSESEARSIAAAKADAEWTRILAEFPGALRPTDSFSHWAAPSAGPDVKACYVSAGATVDTGVDSDGNTYLGYTGPNTASYAVAAFDCGYVRFPPRPVPPPTSAQLGYYYDYLTTFVVPCYLVHGAKVEPPPTRQDFISQYQSDSGQSWAPTPPNAGDGPNPVYDGKDAVCSLREPAGNEF